MSVSIYKNNECRYNIDKLEKVVYLINEEALRNIHIDDGEAYITDIDQEPMSLSVYDIELLDADELDERYKFTHTLKFSMNGYVNYRDFEGRYYAIVKTVDGEYWLVNPLFPCKVTYTYTLNSNDSHTDFTLATISNHPTLRIHGMEHATPYECGYRRCTFKSLRLNETIYSLVTGNHVLYTNDGFKDIEYNKNSAVFTETFDGNNVQHKLDFNIKFDNYKDSWHYNLLEFTENRYAAIVETSCDKFVLCGFGFGLQPTFNVTANDDMTMDNILISLVDTHDNGSFVSYQDEITVEKDGTTKWMYTTKYNGYECIGDGIARYLLKEEVDALMNPTGNYMCLVGYEEQFSFLNIVDTFTENVIFNSVECVDTCKLQSSFPLEFVFNKTMCRNYTLISDSDWSITSSASHITVTPSSGAGGESYTVGICNTLEPSETIVNSTLTVEYCNKTKVYNVEVKQGDDCLPAGSVFDISANGQYVTIPTSCCVKTVTDPSGIITSVIIQNSYVKVYAPQNDTGVVRQFILEFTYCDDKEGEVIINQSNGFEKWVKEDTACTRNQKCDVERKYTGTTAFDINTRTEETRLANCSPSEDCSSVTTRWIDSTETTCNGGKKYLIQIEQSSSDGGQTWVETGLKRLGNEVEDPNNECAGVETEEEWVQDGYVCEDTTKYARERLYTRVVGTVDWIATDTYRRTDTVIETNSTDCGYVHPSETWKCEKWEIDNGYICEGTTKYAREQRYVRDCADCNNCNSEWIETGVYRRTTTVLETNSTDCGYIKGSDEWTCEKWEVVDGDYICEDGTKYTKERRYVRECEDCSDCSTPWVATDAYRRGSTILEVNSIDCGYIIPSTAYTWDDWRVVDNDYICEDGDKYEKLRRWVSNDQVSTKSEVVHWIPTDVYKRGQLIETNSTDCGYDPTVTGNCTEYRDEGDTICDGFDKYKYLRKYVRNCTDCSNCSAAWLATLIYKRGDLIQSNSTDCGYIKSSDEWTCEKWETADGYICEETTKYAREQRYVRECEDCNNCEAEWIATSVYRRTNTVLEINSTDCGYVKPSTAWTCSKWEVVDGDYICEDGTKYTKERRYVRECEDCSDCSAPWIPTDAYRRGSTVLEENSTDCGYDPTLSGNCTEYRDEGDTICDGFDKYKYLRKYVRECENCNDCSAAWVATNIYKRGTLIQANSVDCGYIPTDTYERWVEDGYMCDGYSKYKRLRKEISEDNVQWYRTSIYKRGTLIENNSTDCGYNQAVTGNCSEYRDEGDTICNEYNKYKYLRKYVRFCENCSNCSSIWLPTNIFKRGDLVQENSFDCGYIPRGTYERWIVEGTICNGYDKYYLETKEVSDNNINWYKTNIHRRGSLIQAKSFDCGYIPTENCYEWRNSGTLCNGFDKYNRLRKYISDDCVRWYETNIYKQGSLIEENSADCGYVPKIEYEYRWVETDSTKCVGTTKYYQYKKQRRRSDILGSQWEDVIPTVYSIDGDGTLQPRIAEVDSPDCGYVPPVEPTYQWFNMDITRYWICGDCGEEPTDLPKIEYRLVGGTIESATCNANATLTSSDYGNEGTIEYAKIGSCITTIGNGAFSGKTSLSQVLIPSTVTNIGDKAFYGCTGLIDFSLPMSVTAIGASAFTNDIQFNKIMLPNSLTSIGDYALSGCKNFPSINIPEGITIIPTGCFYDCDGMTDIYLPENVRLIKSKAFGNCNGLVNFTCYAIEPPAIYSDTFSNMNENLKIYVPAAVVDDYKAAWSAYADNIVAIGE